MQTFLTNESIKFCKWETHQMSENLRVLKDKPLRLSAAQNDWIAFQIVFFRAEDDYAICIDDTPHLCIEGNYDIFRVETVVKNGSFKISQQILGFVDDDTRKLYSDILSVDSCKFFDRTDITPVWVEIETGLDTAPQKYDGEVKIYKRKRFEEETLDRILPFKFEVFDTVLSKPKENPFYLDLWQHNANIARKHEVKLYSERHFEIMEHYVKALSDLGQKAITIIASDAPWCSQWSYRDRDYLSDFFEYSCIDAYKTKNGKIECDFTKMQRYIDLCMKYNIKSEIEVFGIANVWTDEEFGYGKLAEDYLDAIRVRCYDIEKERYFYLHTAGDIKEYIQCIHQYFVEQGLIDKVKIIADEPRDYKAFMEKLRMLKELCPGFRYKIAFYHPEFAEFADDTITDFVPILKTFADFNEQMQTVIQSKPNFRFLFYVCCEPDYPNTFINSDLNESRCIPYLSILLNTKGFLRWNFTAWPDKPRERLAFRSGWFKSGDTNFVYPSNNGTPLLSLRYKSLKRGIEDYALFVRATKEAQNDVLNLILKEKDIAKFYDKSVGNIYEKGGKLFSVEYDDYVTAKELLMKNQE